jgi:hypothetical protein
MPAGLCTESTGPDPAGEVYQINRSDTPSSCPSEIVQALVGLKDVRVLHYARRGPEVELVIEQVVSEPAMSGLRWSGSGERAKQCLLTTRVAKWATVQVGTGRTVSEVAADLDCDWHTVNDAVTTYGSALLAADHKRLNRTVAIGLDETSFVGLGDHHTSYVTTVADVEHHQIVDILPSRHFVDVAGFLDKRPRGRTGSPSVRWTCPPPTPRSRR